MVLSNSAKKKKKKKLGLISQCISSMFTDILNLGWREFIKPEATVLKGSQTTKQFIYNGPSKLKRVSTESTIMIHERTQCSKNLSAKVLKLKEKKKKKKKDKEH